MKFHRFKVDKLIRDKLAGTWEKEGHIFCMQHLQGQEHVDHLKLKLLEEAAEVQEATSKSDLTEEMADVLEVIHALAKASHTTLEDIEAKRIEKRSIRGGFDQGSFCAYMDIPDGQPAVEKYKALAHKYPEIDISED